MQEIEKNINYFRLKYLDIFNKNKNKIFNLILDHSNFVFFVPYLFYDFISIDREIIVKEFDSLIMTLEYTLKSYVTKNFYLGENVLKEFLHQYENLDSKWRFEVGKKVILSYFLLNQNTFHSKDLIYKEDNIILCEHYYYHVHFFENVFSPFFFIFLNQLENDPEIYKYIIEYFESFEFDIQSIHWSEFSKHSFEYLFKNSKKIQKKYNQIL